MKVIEANGPEYRPQLALSTLALDTGSCDPRLPLEAAKLGVPCIGLAQQRENAFGSHTTFKDGGADALENAFQALAWPELSLEKPDPTDSCRVRASDAHRSGSRHRAVYECSQETG